MGRMYPIYNGLFKHMNPKLFPTLLIILDLLAMIVYYSQGDIRKGTYWMSAAVLTVCVTF